MASHRAQMETNFGAMKILIFYQYFGTPNGSWSTRVYELCKIWIDKGVQPVVLTSIYDKSDIKAKGLYSRKIIDGIEVIALNIHLSNKHNILRRIWSFLCYLVLAVYFAMHERFDIALSSSGPLSVGIPGFLAKKIRGKKFIFEVRDIWPEGAIGLGLIKNPLIILLLRWMAKIFYQSADLVVSASPDQTDFIQKFSGVEKVLTIPNASDVHLANEIQSKSTPLTFLSNEKYVVYTGTFGLVDDCLQILEAFSKLKDWGRNDIYCFMIGDGSEYEKLNAFKHQQALSNVVFTGIMSKYDVFKYLRFSKASIFSLKDVQELNAASPNKIFDAFALGIPIIQMSKGWVAQLVTESGCGINVPFNQPEALARAIMELADNIELQQTMGIASAELGKTTFNRQILGNQYFESIKAHTLS